MRLTASVGVRMKQLRADRGMTAEDVSEAAHRASSRPRVSDIERGDRGGDIRVAELLAIAHALNVSPADLLFPGDEAEIAPGVTIPTSEARVWLSGIDPELIRQGELRKAEQDLAEAQARVNDLRKAHQ